MTRIFFTGNHKYLPIEIDAHSLPSSIKNTPPNLVFFDQGWNFCIFATKSNNWFGYGNNLQGQMDIRNKSNGGIFQLTTFQELKPILAACNYNSTFLLSSNGYLYATGGRFGLELRKLDLLGKILRFSICSDKIVAIPQGTGIAVLDHASEVPTILCNQISFVDISAGTHHFLALSSTFVPYSCTFSKQFSAACGREHYPKEFELAPISIVPKIQRVFACGNNSFLFDENRRLWVAGQNFSYSLGLNSSQPLSTFTQLSVFTSAKIQQISGDDNSTFLITDTGHVFGTGSQAHYLHRKDALVSHNHFEQSSLYRSHTTFISFKFDRLLLGVGMKRVLIPTRISNSIQVELNRDTNITPLPEFSHPVINMSCVLTAGDNSSRLLLRDGTDSLAISSNIPASLFLLASTRNYTIFATKTFPNGIEPEDENDPIQRADIKWFGVSKEKPDEILELLHLKVVLSNVIDVVGLHASVLMLTSSGSLLLLGKSIIMTPELIETPSPAIKISGYGETFAAILSDGGILYKEIGENPTLLLSNKFFSDISVGINAFVCLHENGSALIFNGSFLPIHTSQQIRFTAVGCTTHDIILIDQDDRVHICNWKCSFHDPGPIKSREVSKVITDFGNDAAFLITKKNTIWCKGSNNNCLLMMDHKKPVRYFSKPALLKDQKIAKFFSSSGRIFILVKKDPPKVVPKAPALLIPSLKSISSFQRIKKLGIGPYGDCLLIKAPQALSKDSTDEDGFSIFAAKFLKDSINRVMDIERKNQFVQILDPLTKPKYNHPSLLQYLLVFLGDGTYPPGVATQYMENGTLGDIFLNVRYNNPPSLWNTTRRVIFALEIAIAMQYLHDKTETIHGNLTPDNIFINKGLDAVVGDFGLAKADDEIGIWNETGREARAPYLAPELFISGQFYMSPEYVMEQTEKDQLMMKPPFPTEESLEKQSRINKSRFQDKFAVSVTKEADVFAYGMILYEIIEEKKPFEELRKNAAVSLAIAKRKRPLFTNGIKPFAMELISKCWAHEPILRPTFSEIVQEMNDHNFDLLPNIDFVSIKKVYNELTSCF